MKNSYVIGLIGLLAAIATVLGLRSCNGQTDIFEPGERIVTEVDWGQYSPQQFDGQIFTYARKRKSGSTVVILVPFASGSSIKKVHEGPDGADGYRIELDRTAASEGDGVYQLTVDGIPGDVSHVIVQLNGGEGHDVVLADADDESLGHFEDSPVPVMQVVHYVNAASAPDVVRGFLILPDKSNVTWSSPTVGAAEAVLKVNITTAQEDPELYFMSAEFGAPQDKNKVALVVDGNDGRTWSYRRPR